MIRPTCPVCNVPMLMRKQIAGNGTKQIGWYCVQCERWEQPTRWLAHKDVTDCLRAYQATIDNIPTVNDYRDVPCVVCGQIGTETHHWMPRTLKQSGPPGNRSRRRYANITTICGTTW